MKKYVKIAIIVILIIIVLLILNTIRNVFIINKIKNTANEYSSDMDSYKLTIVSNYAKEIPDSRETVEGICTETIYYKDNKTIKKTLYQCEGFEDEENKEELKDLTYLDYMKIDLFLNEFSQLSNKFMIYCFNFITTNDESYIINFDGITTYFNKETGLLEKYPVSTYSIEKNAVTDEEFKNL